MKKNILLSLVTAAVAIPAVIVSVMACRNGSASLRPEGPCDVYAQGGTPCASAHSTTRALFKDYNGPLYQVLRASDGKTLDIGVVKPKAGDPGGYADAAAQDAFCKDTYCWITVIYDQGPMGNHLRQAPRGGFSGHAMGGFNNIPLADWAPVTIMGHKVYGVYITPGMGLRWNDTKGIAVDDQAEGQYWVIAGNHYNDGCCFDYGNAETDSRDDGDGTMETTYFGNSLGWYHGVEPGPWIMTDQENNLVGCVNEDPDDKYCETVPTITWRFVTSTADGEPHHWRSMGGNAQEGELQVFYDGKRIQNPRNSYDPMRKQGAILLGNGGDNSVGSQGTFYEGAITMADTFPTQETCQAVQANIVAARYDVERLTVGSEKDINAPNRLQTFVPGESQKVAVKFVNTTGEELTDLTLRIIAPNGWNVEEGAFKPDYAVAPGQTVIRSFTVTPGNAEFMGDLVAEAKWGRNTETAREKVRNTAPVKINEFRVADDLGNATNSYIELYNTSDKAVDASGWTVTHHPIHIPQFSEVVIPEGTTLAPKSFYVLGLATSGLAVQAAKGDKVLYLRSVEGIKPGDEITIGTGKNVETRKVAAVNAPEPLAEVEGNPFMRRVVRGTPTTVWQPLPEGPVITIPAGSKNIPVTSTFDFVPGGKMAIGYGATYPAVGMSKEKYEVVTITEVGKPGTQAWLAYDAKPGETNIKVSSVENISVGDVIRLDIDSKGHGIETVKVKAVGTASELRPSRGPMPLEQAGTGLELEEPLKYAHAANMPFAVNGTGISFEPATRHDHSSNEPVLALIYSIELEEALASDHDIDEAVLDASVTVAGFQGEADQYYGGPAFGSAGSIILRSAQGVVADALNYGLIVDPWVSEGFHGVSGRDKGGSRVSIFTPPRRSWRAPAIPYTTPNVSSGRYPDGADADDNINDFALQPYYFLSAPLKPGDRVLQVSGSMEGLKEGARFLLGTGAAAEEVQIAKIVEGSPLIGLAAPVKGRYAPGAPLVAGVPTPGAPNTY